MEIDTDEGKSLRSLVPALNNLVKQLCETDCMERPPEAGKQWMYNVRNFFKNHGLQQKQIISNLQACKKIILCMQKKGVPKGR